MDHQAATSRLPVSQLPSAVTAPPRWERIVHDGNATPSGIPLKSAEEVKAYLTSDTTCKCGLQCPLFVDKVFIFDGRVKTTEATNDALQDSSSACKHALEHQQSAGQNEAEQGPSIVVPPASKNPAVPLDGGLSVRMRPSLKQPNILLQNSIEAQQHQIQLKIREANVRHGHVLSPVPSVLLHPGSSVPQSTPEPNGNERASTQAGPYGASSTRAVQLCPPQASPQGSQSINAPRVVSRGKKKQRHHSTPMYDSLSPPPNKKRRSKSQEEQQWYYSMMRNCTSSGPHSPVAPGLLPGGMPAFYQSSLPFLNIYGQPTSNLINFQPSLPVMGHPMFNRGGGGNFANLMRQASPVSLIGQYPGPQFGISGYGGSLPIVHAGNSVPFHIPPQSIAQEVLFRPPNVQHLGFLPQNGECTMVDDASVPVSQPHIVLQAPKTVKDILAKNRLLKKGEGKGSDEPSISSGVESHGVSHDAVEDGKSQGSSSKQTSDESGDVLSPDPDTGEVVHSAKPDAPPSVKRSPHLRRKDSEDIRNEVAEMLCSLSGGNPSGEKVGNSDVATDKTPKASSVPGKLVVVTTGESASDKLLAENEGHSMVTEEKGERELPREVDSSSVGLPMIDKCKNNNMEEGVGKAVEKMEKSHAPNSTDRDKDSLAVSNGGSASSAISSMLKKDATDTSQGTVKDTLLSSLHQGAIADNAARGQIFSEPRNVSAQFPGSQPSKEEQTERGRNTDMDDPSRSPTERPDGDSNEPPQNLKIPVNNNGSVSIQGEATPQGVAGITAAETDTPCLDPRETSMTVVSDKQDQVSDSPKPVVIPEPTTVSTDAPVVVEDEQLIIPDEEDSRCESHTVIPLPPSGENEAADVCQGTQGSLSPVEPPHSQDSGHPEVGRDSLETLDKNGNDSCIQTELPNRGEVEMNTQMNYLLNEPKGDISSAGKTPENKVDEAIEERVIAKGGVSDTPQECRNSLEETKTGDNVHIFGESGSSSEERTSEGGEGNKCNDHDVCGRTSCEAEIDTGGPEKELSLPASDVEQGAGDCREQDESCLQGDRISEPVDGGKFCLGRSEPLDVRLTASSNESLGLDARNGARQGESVDGNAAPEKTEVISESVGDRSQRSHEQPLAKMAASLVVEKPSNSSARSSDSNTGSSDKENVEDKEDSSSSQIPAKGSLLQGTTLKDSLRTEPHHNLPDCQSESPLIVEYKDSGSPSESILSDSTSLNVNTEGDRQYSKEPESSNLICSLDLASSNFAEVSPRRNTMGDGRDIGVNSYADSKGHFLDGRSSSFEGMITRRRQLDPALDMERSIGSMDLSSRTLRRHFETGDLVWGQTRGHPSWPGKLVSENDVKGPRRKELGKVWVMWFGDHSYAQVEPDKLKTLSEGLEDHHNARTRVSRARRLTTNLEAAIQEAMMELDKQTEQQEKTGKRSSISTRTRHVKRQKNR